MKVDENLQEDVALHCLGGFVVTMLYGLARSTADVDVITVAPLCSRLEGSLSSATWVRDR